MPTIDELAPASSVSDTDEMVVSQSDIARKATRAQILAGVQPALALPQGTLLGRISSGTGSPEAIAIGANLTVANSILSAPPAFTIASQTMGGSPSPGDLVAMAQGGQNTALKYATFATGLSSIAGIDTSHFAASPTGGVGSRALADLFSDAITVESFGAVGDGATDDTAAFDAAFSSGRPVRLSNRIYAIAGSLAISGLTTIVGVAGASVIRRISMTVDPWVRVSSAQFAASGVIFDAGGLAASNGPAVAIESGCEAAYFADCQFMRAVGLTEGDGLSINGNSSTTVLLLNCHFSNNGRDGLNVNTAGSVVIRGSNSTGNGGCGYCIQSGIGVQAAGNTSTGNQTGIALGAWQSAASATDESVVCDLNSNICTGNATWGIAVAATGGSISNNILSGNGSGAEGGGLLCRLVNSLVVGNQIQSGSIGIDARTTTSSVIEGNHISNCTTGMELGAAQNLVAAGNFILQNTWGVTVTAFEPSLSNSPTGPISIERNWFGFTLAQGGGLRILDGLKGASIVGNDFNGWGSATSAQSLWVHTDAAIVRGNRWNNSAEFSVAATTIGGRPSLVIPDVADDVVVISAPPDISAVLTEHQVSTLGQIGFIRVTQGGSRYTQATATISGAGTGASATVVCANGQVAGILLTNSGSGYGQIGAAALVSISGNGSGAAATAFVGLPVLSGRGLDITCTCQVRLVVAGSAPSQQTWSQYDLTIPAFGAASLMGVFGGWFAVQSPPVDYLAPLGNGGAVLQSTGGADLFLRPAAGGSLHISNGNEPTGCTTTVGRGSPTGSVAAPPGSDFRNLNGGAGNTLWVKCSGTDASGWVAVA